MAGTVAQVYLLQLLARIRILQHNRRTARLAALSLPQSELTCRCVNMEKESNMRIVRNIRHLRQMVCFPCHQSTNGRREGKSSVAWQTLQIERSRRP
jgi:hypothetical protein